MRNFLMRYIVPVEIDLTRGVQKVTEEVVSTIKSIVPIIFSGLTVAGLAVSGFLLAKALFSYYKSNHQADFMPVIWAAVGTLICGMFSAITFFSWFGV